MQVTVWQNKHNRSQWGWTVLISEPETVQLSSVNEEEEVLFDTPDEAYRVGMMILRQHAVDFGLMEPVGS